LTFWISSLWHLGPYSISSLSGAKYFLTIVDDYSRFEKVKHINYWLFFFSFIKMQFNAFIANFCTDSGT
jgi:hypothetical protein